MQLLVSNGKMMKLTNLETAQIEKLSDSFVIALRDNQLWKLREEAKKILPVQFQQDAEILELANKVLLSANENRNKLPKIKTGKDKHECLKVLRDVFNVVSKPSIDFYPLEKKLFAEAAKKRLEHPEVEKLFNGADRIYLQALNENNKSALEAEITYQLKGHGYIITDYHKGLATNTQGNQVFKIGKLLKGNIELLKSFNEDPYRTKENTLIVISRNTDDIARMSTNRRWVSCLGSDKELSFRIPAQIEAGVLIAYLISKDDININNPLARCLIKNYYSKETSYETPIEKTKTIYHASNVYGFPTENFKTVIQEYLDINLNEGKTGIFEADRRLELDRNEAPFLDLTP